ncbi:MAG TPA: GNAT family N-acetyltransferase [Anaerolineae bacterium]|nr:GNAT family N-acetyltransferase [Anaerolineae bacterium]
MKITAFRPEHLEAAAGLVAARCGALRSQLPSLPTRYEDAGVVADMLRELDWTAGVVALQAGRLLGFMTGFVLPEFLGKRGFYSPEWANGAQPGKSREVYEEMYRCASPRWIADRCPVHAVTLADDHQGIEGWQWLGFGLAAVDGVRDLSPVQGGRANLSLRQAGPEDAGELTALDQALAQHMAAPPVYWTHDAEDRCEWLRDPDHIAWLAYEDEEAVGCLGLELGRAGGCQIVQDEKTAGITIAYVREGARGKGITTALLNQALAWLRGHGYERCATDWEPMNPPANRYWPKRFEVVCYSLMRWIDERIVARMAGEDISRTCPLGEEGREL